MGMMDHDGTTPRKTYSLDELGRMIRNRILTFLLACVVTWVVFFAPHAAPNVYQTAQRASVALEVIDGSGSGFVVIRPNKAGADRVFLFTANHIMVPAINQAKAKIYLRGPDHQKRGVISLDAQLMARFEEIDIAVLQLGAGSEIFSRLQFASDTAQPGDKLFAVGSPHKGEHDNAIVEGIVSQVGFDFNEQIRGWSNVDQMSAQVNPGNSGGPVLNLSGKVIGVSIGTEHNGINFFVPVRAIRNSATAAGLGWLMDNRGTAPSDAELARRTKDQTYE